MDEHSASNYCDGIANAVSQLKSAATACKYMTQECDNSAAKGRQYVSTINIIIPPFIECNMIPFDCNVRAGTETMSE